MSASPRDDAVLGTFARTALKGKACLVTGAASGQGRAIATRFAEAGARVAMVDLDAEALGEAARAIQSTIGVELPIRIVANLSRADECRRASVYAVSGAAVPHLRAAGGGSIVNFSSGVAHRTVPANASHAYSASKGAIESLTKAMAISYGKDGIRVNAIVPGVVDTPMSKRLIDKLAPGEHGGSVLGRYGVPDDAAGCVLFLVSEAAGYVTGVTLPMDGGTSVRRAS